MRSQAQYPKSNTTQQASQGDNSLSIRLIEAYSHWQTMGKGCAMLTMFRAQLENFLMRSTTI